MNHQRSKLWEELTPEERSLVEATGEGQSVVPKRHSILGLRGLGKEIWQGIDVDDYIDRKRRPSNGL